MTDPSSPAQTYRAIYERELDSEARWLAYGAKAKVDSIEQLLARNSIRPESLLELGCGTGALLQECERRRLATHLVGFDYSPEAIAHLAATAPRIRGMVGDLTDPAFSITEDFDVVVLSHVLEHLDEPLRVLKHIVETLSFRHMVIEVPLEDLAGSRVKGLVRDRRRNTAGHVQFFTSAAFRTLLRDAGLSITDERTYAPVISTEMMKMVARRHGFTRSAAILHLAVNNWFPRMLGPVWKRAYYGHHAALCVRS